MPGQKDFMAHESRFPAWAWWIIGAITILAISILVFSVVLGIRAGQEQVEIQRRQQIGIALQRATDAQAEGNLQAALDEYQTILVLDPSNDLAQQGIKNLLALASSGEPAAAQPAAGGETAASPLSAPTATATAVATVAAAPTSTPASTLVGYWDDAQRAIKAGRWQEALNNLILVQQMDPAYRVSEVNDELFTAYVNLALEKDNADNLEEALTLYQKALALRPGATDIQRDRDLLEQYLQVLTYTGVDWELTIEELTALFNLEPDYRDVAERLQQAHAARADELAGDEDWCAAQDEYNAALSVVSDGDLILKRDAAQTQCRLADTGGAASTGTARLTPGATPAATAAGVSAATSGDGPAGGRLLYSSSDPITGRSQIMSLTIGRSTPAQLLLEEAAQPALRSDGTRLAFRNLRNDMAGISSFDPGTGLMLRFSQYAEDSLPSWNPQGSRVVIASNREGDRRWRIYTMWAEEGGGTDTLGFGESPDWHPNSDLIAFRGCDQSGNRCGIWTISSNGANAAPLTNVPADDRPRWSPTGSFVAFMSNARDGNYEIYTVDASTREVNRLTNDPANDVLPAVSPDGRWVAFASNRDGSWKLYAVSSSGGEPRLLAPIVGSLGNFLEHGLEWVN